MAKNAQKEEKNDQKCPKYPSEITLRYLTGQAKK